MPVMFPPWVSGAAALRVTMRWDHTPRFIIGTPHPRISLEKQYRRSGNMSALSWDYLIRLVIHLPMVKLPAFLSEFPRID